MKGIARERIAALLLVLFVVFAAGNTMFVHTHVGPKGAVTHSHPYLPSSHHGHSVVEFSSIAVLNASGYDGAGSDGCFVASPLRSCEYLMPAECLACAGGADVRLQSLRAPPECV